MRNVLWSPASVCLSAATLLHRLWCNLGSDRGCPLVVHYWADLQFGHRWSCYGNITRNVSEYMLVLALCLVLLGYQRGVKFSRYVIYVMLTICQINKQYHSRDCINNTRDCVLIMYDVCLIKPNIQYYCLHTNWVLSSLEATRRAQVAFRNRKPHS